ncbi:hypothetical protein IQ225_18170 [Synechocystis salina LEGE 06155]|nr:hypothetical protein [Synechocystis salina LEGE 06155]
MPKKLTPKAEAQSESTSPERLRELAQEPELAVVVASNVITPPELLEELSHSKDQSVREACAGNPNTPTEVLLLLAGQFTEQLLENPVFELLLIENPNLVAQFPKRSLNSLVKRDTTPVSFLRWAAENGEENTLSALLVNPKVPGEVVQRLSNHSQEVVALAAKGHVNSGMEPEAAWEIEALRERKSSKKDNNIEYLHVLGGLRSTDVFLLPVDTRLTIANNPHNAPETLAVLVTDSEPTVSGSALANPTYAGTGQSATANQSSDVSPSATMMEPPDFAELAKAKKSDVRQQVAQHPQCPEEILLQLSLDKDLAVRWQVMAHPHCPPRSVLLELALKQFIKSPTDGLNSD